MNQPFYFYLIENKKYIDFQTFLLIYSQPDNILFDRSNLWRYLKNCKVTTKLIGNKKVYLLDDIFSDIYLIERMQNITVLAEALDAN